MFGKLNIYYEDVLGAGISVFAPVFDQTGYFNKTISISGFAGFGITEVLMVIFVF